MFFEGFFSSPTGIDFNVAFMETMIYTPEKLYSFSLVNDNPTAFADSGEDRGCPQIQSPCLTRYSENISSMSTALVEMGIAIRVMLRK